MDTGRRISLQSASKRFPSFGPPGKGNKSNTKKSRSRPNRNLTETIYHLSVILRSFSVVLNSAKRDANRFFKVLLLSSHLLISRHPVRKSKCGARAVTGDCSFKGECYDILSKILIVSFALRGGYLRLILCNSFFIISHMH